MIIQELNLKKAKEMFGINTELIKSMSSLYFHDDFMDFEELIKDKIY